MLDHRMRCERDNEKGSVIYHPGNGGKEQGTLISERGHKKELISPAILCWVSIKSWQQLESATSFLSCCCNLKRASKGSLQGHTEKIGQCCPRPCGYWKRQQDSFFYGKISFFRWAQYIGIFFSFPGRAQMIIFFPYTLKINWIWHCAWVHIHIIKFKLLLLSPNSFHSMCRNCVRLHKLTKTSSSFCNLNFLHFLLTI